MNADDRAVGEPEHLHPLFLLTGIGSSLRRVAGAYAAVAYLAVSGKMSLAITMAVALLIFGIISIFIYWRRFEFRVGASEIRIDSGVLSRTHRSIPFDRIQDVDITQGPAARLLGLARVTFETGGGSAATGKEEGVLQAISLVRAEELRRRVRSQRAAALSAEVVPEEAKARPIYAMDLRRLLLAGLFNFSLALFAGLFGLTQTFGDVLGFDPFDRSFWQRVLSAGGPLRSYIMAHQAVAILAGALVLILVGLLTGAIRTILRDYGFRLERTGVGLRRRRGLLTRTDVTLPVRRAQAAIVMTGPIKEGLGYSELRVQSLARDEDRSGNHVLAPLATAEEVGNIIAELGWRPISRGEDWEQVSSTYVWKFAGMVSPIILVAAAQLAFAPLFSLAWFLVPAVLVALRYLDWRRIGYRLDGDRILVRSGWWRRRTTILPLTKIQSIDLKESFVSRWFGTSSLQFGVAGGTALVAHSIPAIPRGRARELRDQLLGFRS
jgi:putative membrane protein